MATNDLHAALQRLAALPLTERPLLSIYLDWTIDSSGKRLAPRILEHELDHIAARFSEHTPDRASLTADRQRVTDFVNDQAPIDAGGLAIFACHAAGVWETIAMRAPFETAIVVDRRPHTFTLAHALDEYETYAVALTDGQEARMFVITPNEARQVGATVAEEKVKRIDYGGEAQLLLQRRTDNLIKAHIKDLAELLGQTIARHDARHAVIACNDAIKGIVMETLPDAISARIAGYINLDTHSNIPAIIAAIDPIMRAVERKQEADEIAALETRMATKGGLAAAGVADVAMTLAKGQVQTLLMLRQFNASGDECPTCGMLQTDGSEACPYDGTRLLRVNLREVFTARALQQHTGIQIVESSERLAMYEGIGALLRYRDDVREQIA